MRICERDSNKWLLCVIFVATAPGTAFASDELTAKVRKAWEKFSESEEIKADYGERAQIALTMLEVERQRIEFDALAKDRQVQVDSFPRRRNNLQEDVYQELLYFRHQRAACDNNLAQLRLQWQELNEIAIGQAQAAGKRVKPLDRPGLLNELQRLDREWTTAFESVKNALPDAARAEGVTEPAAFNNAMNEVEATKDPTVRLVPGKQFSVAFKQYYGQRTSERPKKSGRVYRKRQSGS